MTAMPEQVELVLIEEQFAVPERMKSVVLLMLAVQELAATVELVFCTETTRGAELEARLVLLMSADAPKTKATLALFELGATVGVGVGVAVAPGVAVADPIFQKQT